MHIFDSHLHLNSDHFAGKEAEAWQKANAVGVREGTVVGYNLESSKKAIEIANQLAGIYATVGVSPHDYQEAPADYIEQLEQLAQDPSVVAIGEAGLEYHYPAGPREFQLDHFRKQIALAKKLNKTLVVHLRDGDADMMQIIQEEAPPMLILHCFTGSMEMMRFAAERGHYISFSGIVTFKNAKDIQAVAQETPRNNILIETDAPYLAPVPHRGKPCEPYMIADTAQFVANLRGEEIEMFIKQTTTNARAAFGINHTQEF